MKNYIIEWSTMSKSEEDAMYRRLVGREPAENTEDELKYLEELDTDDWCALAIKWLEEIN